MCMSSPLPNPLCLVFCAGHPPLLADTAHYIEWLWFKHYLVLLSKMWPSLLGKLVFAWCLKGGRVWSLLSRHFGSNLPSILHSCGFMFGWLELCFYLILSLCVREAGGIKLSLLWHPKSAIFAFPRVSVLRTERWGLWHSRRRSIRAPFSAHVFTLNWFGISQKALEMLASVWEEHRAEGHVRRVTQCPTRSGGKTAQHCRALQLSPCGQWLGTVYILLYYLWYFFFYFNLMQTRVLTQWE